MKKIFIFTLIIVSFGLIQKVEATSGACSYHGGVKCGAGPDWDGSEICNDGWTDSAVSYISSEECMNYVSCTNSELETLYQKYDVHDLEKQKIDNQSKIYTINIELATALIDVEGKPITMNSIISQKNRLINDANSQIFFLQSQLDIINFQLSSAINSVLTECKTLGVARINQLQQQVYLSKLAQEQSAKEAKEKELVALQNALSQIQCSNNSTLKTDGKCYCNTGYINSDMSNDCVTLDERCNELTPNSHHKDGQCYCNDGMLYINGLCTIIDKPKNEEERQINSSPVDTSIKKPQESEIKIGKNIKKIVNETAAASGLVLKKNKLLLYDDLKKDVVTTTTVDTLKKTDQPNKDKQQNKIVLKNGKLKKITNGVAESLKRFFVKIKFW